MTTNKLLPLTTFVAAAMSFAIPTWAATDYTWAGEDSSSDTYVLRDFEETDDDSSAIKLGEKILKEDPLAFALYATSAVPEGSDGSASGSVSASSGGEILEQVEITESTSTNLNRALTLASKTNTSDDMVTVRQSVVAMSMSSDNSTEQYAVDAGKSYYEQVSISNSGSAVTTYSATSFLGNSNSVGDGNGGYGISAIDSGIVPYATDQTWVGGNDNNNWSNGSNWSSSSWNSSDNATFDASGSSKTVTVDQAITAGTITVTGEYIFEYLEGASLTVTGNVTIGNLNGDNSSLTIKGGTNTFGSSSNNVYIGYNSGSTGTLTIEDGTNTFEKMYVGQNGTGYLYISGGTNTFESTVNVAYNNNSEGYLNISGGKNTFSGEVDVGYNGTATITIENGTNTFESTVYVGRGGSSTGTLTIEGGENTFSAEVDVGYQGTGTLTIEDGTNTFESTVKVGAASAGKSSTTGTITITGGKNTFSAEVDVGYSYDKTTSTLTIEGGENTFLGTINIGRTNMGTNYVGEVKITGGTTTISGTTTIANDDSSLTIGGDSGTATVILETKIGTTTKGSVVISDNASLIISQQFFTNAGVDPNTPTEVAVAVITANTITFGSDTLQYNNSSDSGYVTDLVSQYITVESGAYRVTGWYYYADTGTLYAIVTPEPSMFGLLFGLGAIGIVATRRRRA